MPKHLIPVLGEGETQITALFEGTRTAEGVTFDIPKIISIPRNRNPATRLEVSNGKHRMHIYTSPLGATTLAGRTFLKRAECTITPDAILLESASYINAAPDKLVSCWLVTANSHEYLITCFDYHSAIQPPPKLTNAPDEMIH